jgi:UDP-galactopyranose mutase
MGRTLYRLFVEGYTRKQWGCEPSELSSRFAPRRVDLRDDGNTRLFRDAWEFFPPAGANEVIEAILEPVPVSHGIELTVDAILDLSPPPRAAVITAPLDDLVGRSGDLAWRGIRMASRHFPTAGLRDTVTPAYVVNHPSPSVPFTRTVETKHASGQEVLGTVVSEEHPGAPARHYPVPTVDGVHERRNAELRTEVETRLAGIPTFFCGRLATYTYIDQDQAIDGAMGCAEAVMRRLGGGEAT